MSDFVHLHLHSEYSLLDGACRIADIPKNVKASGQKAVAITDHGNMFGAVDFYKACKNEGVKPIIGCEVYVAPRTRFDKTHGEDSENGHLVLLAENKTGYKNLIKMVSLAYTEGFYSKPRVDVDLLASHSKGLIALSGCLGGFIQRYLSNGNFNAAREHAIKMDSIFGRGNFFLELQNHNLPQQETVNLRLLQLSRSTGIPMVATNDVHYLAKEDSSAQAVLMCIQTNNIITDGRPIGFETDEFYLKSAEQMNALFGEFEGAIENTVRIANRCNFNYEFDKLYLPSYASPDGFTSEAYLESLCRNGLIEYFTLKGKSGIIDKPIYETRLDYELNVIISMGYADYYLIVWDFINYARTNGIPVGPGRGSGAGSLAAFCLGITEVDPIEYNLLFERFLNPERVSMPDFDIDICQDKRGRVVDYVINKYGADKTAHIITFGTMAARGAVRDVGRAMGISYASVDLIAKMIPRDLGMTLEKALSVSAELKTQYESSSEVKNLIDMAMKLEGMPRHSSTHAAGIVITNDDITSYVPLALSSDMIVTQFSMNAVAELGLLKIDLLGLRYLTIINDAVIEIKKTAPDFDPRSIPLDDKAVFSLLASGNTEGVFQFESGGMKNLLASLKPEYLEDLIAAIALFRPGPMDSIPTYIQNRHNKEKTQYKHPMLRDILDVTYGCIVYQEQVMQIFRVLAGYSYAGADIVRRAMSKKKADVMEQEREYFVHGKKDENGNIIYPGCEANGISEIDALDIFDDMEDFAKYAFNKSHAAAYAVISYRTAYLKCHYTKEYLAALLTSVLYDTGKISVYINECSRLNIKILPPDINYSVKEFTVSGGDIRYGLLAIKNVGAGFINTIIAERENGLFSSFADFLYRMNKYDNNKRQIEALIKCGIFDSLGEYRSRLLAVYEKCMDNISDERKRNLSGQIDLFGETEAFTIEYPNIPELSATEKLAYEKECAGRFFSGHPLEEYSKHINMLGNDSIYKIQSSFSDDSEGFYKDGDSVTVPGIVASRKIKTTKSGANMAFIELEDEYNSMEIIVFPKMLEEYSRLLVSGSIVAVKGTISVREEETPKLLLNSVIPLKKSLEHTSTTHSVNNHKDYKDKTLYLKISDFSQSLNSKVVNLLELFGGQSPVVFYDSRTQKAFRSNEYKVDINEVMLEELKLQLGAENVKIN